MDISKIKLPNDSVYTLKDGVARKDIQNKIAVQILTSAPTSSTLTYTDDNGTHDYKIGDEVRVQDSENASSNSNGYVYYKLYDITGGEAYWDLSVSTGGGEVVITGTINVSLESYINEQKTNGNDLVSATVTVKNTTDDTVVDTKQWNGEQLTFSSLTPMKSYSITVSSVEGYVTPATQTVNNLGIAETLNKRFAYNADKYTLSISSNLDNDDAIDGVTVSASYTYNGSTVTNTVPATGFIVPAGVVPTITSSSDITNYTKTESVDSTNKIISVSYSTTVYSINISDNQDGTDVVGATVTYNSVQYLHGNTFKVATGTTVSASDFTASDVTNYKKSVSLIGTVVNVVYQTEVVTVTVNTDEDGVTAQGQTITINGIGYAVGATGVVSAKVAFDTQYSISANAWAGEDEYTAPETQSFTAGSDTRAVTMTYLKLRGTLYNLVVTDNQDGDSGASNNATVTVSYLKDGATTTMGTTYKNGDTFLIPTGATTVTVTGNTFSYQGSWAASTALSGTTYTVTYKATKITMSSSRSTLLTININGSSTSSTGTSYTRYAEWGKSWSASADNVASTSASSGTDYFASVNPASGTANTKTVNVTVSWTNKSWSYATGDYANLNLPSGKLWATANVGATNSYDPGLYFSWGDTTGHAKGSGYNFNDTNYKNGTSGSGHNLTANFTSGDVTYDGARAIKGGAWRTPTKAECEELINNCKWVWTTRNNVSGYRIISSSSSTAIFIPVSGYYYGTTLFNSSNGYYWSTSCGSSSYAYYLFFGSSYRSMSSHYRYYGRPIRPIKDPESVYLGGNFAIATGNIAKDSSGNYSIGSPTDYGAYFSWGDTTGHNMDVESYTFNSSNYSSGLSGSGHNLTANFTSGDSTYDAARANLGGSWRVPTYDELNWLVTNCTWNWKASGNTDYNGIAGYEVVGTNGNSIFLPCSGFYGSDGLRNRGSYGYYWSTRYDSDTDAYNLSFNSSNKGMRSNYRNLGFPIRPVCEVPD